MLSSLEHKRNDLYNKVTEMTFNYLNPMMNIICQNQNQNLNMNPLTNSDKNPSLYPEVVNYNNHQQINVDWTLVGDDKMSEGIFVKNNPNGWTSKFLSSALP